MSHRHVGRTTPPAFGSFLGGSRSIWLASLALPVVVVIPVIWAVVRPPPAPPVQDIENVVKTYYGFDPLTPPSRLRRPSAIYHADGNSVRKVCEATPEMLDGKVNESETVSRSRSRLESNEFSLSGAFVVSLNGKLGGTRVASIEYGMKDVMISEIAEAALGKIERLLMSEKDCEDTVIGLLTANKKVCSGYSSLTASIVYKVRFERSSEAAAQVKLADVIKKAIEEASGGKISARSAEEFSGEKLIYGILLSSRCIVLDTSPQPDLGRRTAVIARPKPEDLKSSD